MAGQGEGSRGWGFQGFGLATKLKRGSLGDVGLRPTRAEGLPSEVTNESWG